MTHSRARAAAWAWLLSTAAMLAVELVVPVAWELPWNPLERTISELGAVTCGPVAFADGPREVCSPWSGLAIAGWAIGGLALVLGAVLARSLIGIATTVLLMVTGLSNVAVGLVPLDTQPDLHLLVAVPAFLAGNAALLVVAARLRGRSPGLARAALVLGLLGVIGFGLTVAWVWVGGPLGLWERLAAYCVQVWVVLAAPTMLGSRYPMSDRIASD